MYGKSARASFDFAAYNKCIAPVKDTEREVVIVTTEYCPASAEKVAIDSQRAVNSTVTFALLHCPFA
jgi:hypothetical protein